jgi:hypothetical protein
LNAPAAGETPGQAALLEQAGPAAPANIRRTVDEESRNASANEGFVDKLLYWRKPNTQGAEVDATKEAQRLRQNAALGEAPNVGETPVIQQKKEGWFTHLFSWL